MNKQAAAFISVPLMVAALAVSPVGTLELEVEASVRQISAVSDSDYGVYDSSYSRDLSTAAYFDFDAERNETGALFVVDVDADTKRAVETPRSPTGLQQVVGLSADGSTALIWADWEGIEAGDADAGLADAFLLDTATGSIELLTGALDEVSVAPVSIDDDGDTVLMAVSTSEIEGSLYLFDEGTLEELALPDAAFDNAWGGALQLSGDGTVLLYTSRIGFQSRWHLHRLADGSETVIASPNAVPVMSSDGSLVVATSGASEINSTLHVWDTATTSLRTLEVDGGAGEIRMNEAGTAIISAGYSRVMVQDYEEYIFELSRIDLGTGERVVLATGYDGFSLLAADSDLDRVVARGVQPEARRIPIAPEEVYGGSYQWSTFIIDFSGTQAPIPLPGYSGSLDDQMARLYEAYFDRAPDAGGLEFWREQRAGGRSLASVSDEFARSSEFVETYGDLGDEAFVDLVYENVLDRLPDAGGRSFWLDQLSNGRTRGSLMTLFSESPEFIETTGTQPSPLPNEAAVSRLYAAVFGRSADAAGLAYWVGEANRGVPLDDIAWYFMLTPEFQNVYGGFETDPYAMVTIVYRNGMNRDVDDAGYALADSHYTAARPIEEIMVDIVNSPTFVATTSSTPIGG